MATVTIIPTAKTLFNKPPADAKRMLFMAGFRPVGKDEIPDHGDIIINCSRLYRPGHISVTAFESGIIFKPTNKYPAYDVHYRNLQGYTHTYSKSWFERVMWIKKMKMETPKVEHKVEHSFTIISDCNSWEHEYGCERLREDRIFKTDSRDWAVSAVKSVSKKYPGFTFTLVQLVAEVNTPVEQQVKLFM